MIEYKKIKNVAAMKFEIDGYNIEVNEKKEKRKNTKVIYNDNHNNQLELKYNCNILKMEKDLKKEFRSLYCIAVMIEEG